MTKEIQFEKLHPQELAEIIKTTGTIFVPLGTLEWHERHLPFGVDLYIAYKICLITSKNTGGCVLPPIFLGTDTVYEEDGKKYRGMNIQAKKILPGSIYPLDENIFKKLIESLVCNLISQGFKRIVMVTGHCEPTQMKILQEINDKQDDNCKIILFPNKNIFFNGGLDHAGEIETRLMMAIDESLVDLSKLSKPYTALIGEDPIKATKEDGIEQINNIVKQLTRILES
jgi:creatinine amidohydrolase